MGRWGGVDEVSAECSQGRSRNGRRTLKAWKFGVGNVSQRLVRIALQREAQSGTQLYHYSARLPMAKIPILNFAKNAKFRMGHPPRIVEVTGATVTVDR